MTRSAAQRCPSGNCSARKDMSIMFEKLATTILHGKRAFDKASGDDAGKTVHHIRLATELRTPCQRIRAPR